jgi:hypothetical protein
MHSNLLDLGMHINVVSNDEHVPESKWYIQTIKEQTRCVYNTVPFKRMPSRLVVEMVHASVFWLNFFCSLPWCIRYFQSTRNHSWPEAGLYKTLFGSYVQMHEEHDNSMVTHTTGVIALHPTGNTRQGGYYFLSLTSGRWLNQKRWTELPMPQEVIDRVHVLARRSNANRDLTYAWHDGTIINNDDNDEDDLDYDPEVNEDSDSESDNESLPLDNNDSDDDVDAARSAGQY